MVAAIEYRNYLNNDYISLRVWETDTIFLEVYND
jgi:hypothetical protein